MKQRVTRIFVASCLAALVLGGAGDAHAAKEKFERTKPHTNITTQSVSNETLAVHLEVVDAQSTGGTQPSTKPCQGEADVIIEDAGSGGTLASSRNLALTPGVVQTASYSLPSASVLARTIVILRNMEVDGKQCIFRGEMEFQDIASGQVGRRIPLRRADFVKVK